MRKKGDGSKGGHAVELLQGLYLIHEGRLGLPLMACRSYVCWHVWTRGQAAHYLRRELLVVVKAWVKEGGSDMARLVPEDFAPHSGRIGGATRLATMGANPLIIQRESRWLSSAFMVHVRANTEDCQWVSEVFSCGK